MLLKEAYLLVFFKKHFWIASSCQNVTFAKASARGCLICSFTMKVIHVIILFLVFTKASFACVCDDFDVISKQECGKYEVIFAGTVLKYFPCEKEKGKVIFAVQDVYKGELSKEQELVFECKTDDCPVEFLKDEEWLIFAKKNAAQEIIYHPCSRSRKLLPDTVQDYFTELTGQTFFQEKAFLQDNFNGSIGFDGNLKAKKYEKVDPKLIPIFIGISLIFMIVGILVMRYLKKRKA